MAVCNCFLKAPQLSSYFLPVISRRATNLSAGYGRLKSTVMFSSSVNRTTPLTSPVRAEVKRISRKDEVALGNLRLLFYTLRNEMIIAVITLLSIFLSIASILCRRACIFG